MKIPSLFNSALIVPQNVGLCNNWFILSLQQIALTNDSQREQRGLTYCLTMIRRRTNEQYAYRRAQKTPKEPSINLIVEKVLPSTVRVRTSAVKIYT